MSATKASAFQASEVATRAPSMPRVSTTTPGSLPSATSPDAQPKARSRLRLIDEIVTHDAVDALWIDANLDACLFARRMRKQAAEAEDPVALGRSTRGRFGEDFPLPVANHPDAVVPVGARPDTKESRAARLKARLEPPPDGAGEVVGRRMRVAIPDDADVVASRLVIEGRKRRTESGESERSRALRGRSRARERDG
jgi:hypothetical protein